MKLSMLILSLFLLGGCSSQSVLPDSEEVTTSRKPADEDCKKIGTITGTVGSAKGTREQALADLKQEAANKGANYVQVKQYSDAGTTVTGEAYHCP